MADSESKITINFYDSNENKLNISADFNASSKLNSLFHHVAIFPFIFNTHEIRHSDITIKPRICPNHSGWHCDSDLTILDALHSLNIDQTAIDQILANSFDCIVCFSSSHIGEEQNMECMLSSDDNVSVYTVNTAIPETTNNCQTQITNTLQLPLSTNLNLPSLDATFNDANNTNIQCPNATIIEPQNNDLPPNVEPNPKNEFLSNQFVRTQHQLMGKDVVIPCPAIPHSFDIMTKLPKFPNLSKYASSSNHIYFDAEIEDESNTNTQINKASYYHKIQQINEDKNGQNYDFLNIFPKRIIPQNAEKCTIWTNDCVPSLSSFLLQKKEQRRQETDNNLQRIRIGTHKSSHSQPQCLQNDDEQFENEEPSQSIMHNLVQSGHGSMSYYDELMNAPNTNQNPLQFMTCSVDERILLEPIETKCIELKDGNGRLLRLTQELEAINLVQPWAHCLVYKLLQIFCFKSEFESKKYPNGCWYPIRVHASKSNSKQIVEDCEMLSNVIDGVPVFQDCIHTAQHVIGFVHVYKSSVFIEDVAEIHPNLTDVYKQCHGGLPTKLCTNDDDDDESMVTTKEEEENESMECMEDKYDASGYWLEEKYGSLSPKKQKKVKKNQRHYWFVDKVFKIEPYEVCGTLGGISKFYNLTKRNYKDSLVLGEKLANYLMQQQMNENEVVQRYEYEEAKECELEMNEVSDKDDENDNGLDAEGDIIYLDRTLAKHVGIKSKEKSKKLKADKQIIGWKNVLNDMSVVEVEQYVTLNEEKEEEQNDNDDDDEMKQEIIKNEVDRCKKEEENVVVGEEPAVRCLELYDAVGVDVNIMDDENELFEQSVAPHIDDSTDSDYLGDEEEQLQLEEMSNSVTVSMEPNIKMDENEHVIEEDDDDDIDLEDIEMELLDLNTVTFVTKGGPNEQIKEEMKDIDVDTELNDAVDRELEAIIHDEENENIDIEQENGQIDENNLCNSDKENLLNHPIQITEQDDDEEQTECGDNEKLEEMFHDEHDDVVNEDIDNEQENEKNEDNNSNTSDKENLHNQQIQIKGQMDGEQQTECDSVEKSEEENCRDCVVQIKEELNEDIDFNVNVIKNEPMQIKEYEVFIEENQYEIEDEMMSFIEESQSMIKEDKRESVLNEIVVVNDKNVKKNVFENEQIAFDKINESVTNILTNIDDEQKKSLSKKKLRKMVAKQLNISKTRYKHLIDKCGKLFVQAQRL